MTSAKAKTRLAAKIPPVLVIRRRLAKSRFATNAPKTDEQFEAFTDRLFTEIGKMLDNAEEDAKAILSALPDLEKLAGFEGNEHEKDVYVFLFMRSMEALREKANPFSLIELVSIVNRDTYAARALRQHAPKRQARDFVQAEWERNKEAYGGNKSEFARVYSRRVKNELDVQVTDKQLREVWLRDDPPPASKQAGLQADRE